MRRANISVQVIFFIMMAIIFIWILIFGFQQLFLVEETLSETELVSIENDLEAAFSYCEDPLNRGNFRTFTFDSPSFNAVCILGPTVTTGGGVLDTVLGTFLDTDDNVVLLRVEGSVVSGSFVVSDADPVASFATVPLQTTQCYFDDNFDGVVEVQVTCS